MLTLTNAKYEGDSDFGWVLKYIKDIKRHLHVLEAEMIKKYVRVPIPFLSAGVS